MQRNHLKAFTVFELLVGMCLTSILFSIGFYGLELFQLQARQWQSTQEDLHEWQAFRFLFEHDLYRLSGWELQSASLSAQTDTEQVVYYLEPKQIIRHFQKKQTSVLDTFFLSVNDLVFYQKTKPIRNGNPDEIQLGIEWQGQVLDLHLLIPQSACDLLEITNHEN